MQLPVAGIANTPVRRGTVSELRLCLGPKPKSPEPEGLSPEPPKDPSSCSESFVLLQSWPFGFLLLFLKGLAFRLGFRA